jgi:hypothetical protein
MKKKKRHPPGGTGRGQRSESDRAKDHSAVNTAPTIREQSEQLDKPRVSFWPGRGPFTLAKLQAIMLEYKVLKGQATPSAGDLHTMARALNDIHGAFWLRKTTMRESQFKQAQANHVREAIQVLICFFDQRMQAWDAASAEVIDRERRLYVQFRDFLHAITAHHFQLDMDRDDTALMARQESWHDVAEVVAGTFKIAMLPKTFGNSNAGPVARFVAAVMPLMANESPSVRAWAARI